MSSAIEVKRSFDQRLKRQGIEIPSSSTNANGYPHSLADRFKDLPFWIWDREKHEKEYDKIQSQLYSKKTGSDRIACCFNHVIRLPEKDGIPKPLFDYEQEIFDAIFEHKHVWVKKATGLGITEFMIRLIAWLCLSTNQFAGKQICVVTGPRIDLAITIIKRLKRLFPNHTFEDKEYTLELNGCHIEAYPSHHLDAMRGLKNPKLIFLDEADFFPPGQQQDARDVSERYIAKSDPYIVMVSTPNAPEGLFQSIEQEPDDLCLYHRIKLPYTVGLNKIYTPQEITKERESPSFPREYDLKYIGLVGNVFSTKSIESAIKLGEELERDRKGAIPYSSTKTMGIDAGFGSSKFGIVVCQLVRGFVEILHAEEYDKPDFGEMIEKIIDIRRNYNVSKLFVDDANPEVIRSLKYAYSESQDYHKQIQHLEAKKLNPVDWMDILPVSFRSNHKEMLARLKHMMDKESVAISPKFSKLIIALRTAIATEGSLNKSVTSHDDLLDALRLSLKWFVVPTAIEQQQQQKQHQQGRSGG